MIELNPSVFYGLCFTLWQIVKYYGNLEKTMKTTISRKFSYHKTIKGWPELKVEATGMLYPLASTRCQTKITMGSHYIFVVVAKKRKPIVSRF